MRTGRHIFHAVLLGAALLSATSAAAHAKLVGSTPAASSQGAAPKTISLSFSEKLVPAFSGFDLVTPDGRVLTMKTKVSKDGKSISGTPPARLAPGAYKLTWRIASADGHRMTGGFSFRIG